MTVIYMKIVIKINKQKLNEISTPIVSELLVVEVVFIIYLLLLFVLLSLFLCVEPTFVDTSGDLTTFKFCIYSSKKELHKQGLKMNAI